MGTRDPCGPHVVNPGFLFFLFLESLDYRATRKSRLSNTLVATVNKCRTAMLLEHIINTRLTMAPRANICNPSRLPRTLNKMEIQSRILHQLRSIL